MKMIGFIKQHDDIEGAEDFQYLKNTMPIQLSENELKLIRLYFENCNLIFSWMGYYSDLDTGELIAPQSYFSDGKWIWPAYFPYYLNKFNAWMNYPEFFAYLSDNPQLIEMSKGEIRELTLFIINKFS